MKETIVDNTFIAKMDEYRIPDKSVGLIEACSKNIVVFSQHMLGLPLYSWQIKFLTDIQKAIDGELDEREFVAITSRQVGKSTALTVLAVWTVVFNKRPATMFNTTMFGIVSASDEQSKTVLNEIKKLMQLGDVYMATKYVDEDSKPIFGENFFTDLLSNKDANNTTTITFVKHEPSVHGKFILAGSKAGSTIKSWPPTSVVLGKTLSIAVIDEAGKFDKITDEFVNDYFLHTCSSTDGIFVYTSTPWAPAGHFYRMVDPDGTNGQRGVVSMFTIEAIKIENPKHYNDVQNRFIAPLMKDGKKDEVQRGYYCRFVKGEQTYFDPADVRDVFDESLSMQYEFSKPCDLGLDFGGQVKSRTAITISFMDDENVIRRLFHKTYAVGQDTDLVKDIAELKTKFNIQRIIYDDCPAGVSFVRQMEEKGWDLQPMSFRGEKVSKYGALRASLKRKRVFSYPDEELKTEMYALEHTPGSRQSNIQHAPNYSDDLIDSFLMSVYFFIDVETGFEFFEW